MSEDFFKALFYIVVAGIVLFIMISCQRSNEDRCREMGGTPQDLPRSTSVLCIGPDGRVIPQ